MMGGRRVALPRVGEFGWIWLATAALFLLSAAADPKAVGASSLRLMLPFAAVLAIAACGQAVVIRQRGIDLSVPGMLGFGGILACKLGQPHGMSAGLAVLVTLAVAAAAGAVIGVVITRLGIMPLVATLAANALLLGAIQTYVGGVPVDAPRGLASFALGHVAGVPDTAVTAAAIAVVLSLVIQRTVLGRRYVAVGENPDAARLRRIHADRYIVASYGVAACCYAAGGILLAGYSSTAIPSAGNPYLLSVIAAVVVGGTPFTGGKGSVIATVVAALFLQQLLQLVLDLGAPSSTQYLVQSLAIAGATAFRYVPWARARRLVAVRRGPHGAVAAGPP